MVFCGWRYPILPKLVTFFWMNTSLRFGNSVSRAGTRRLPFACCAASPTHDVLFFCHTKIEANPILPYLSAAVWCWFEWVERVIKRRPKELLFRFRIDNGCYGCGVCERLHKGLQVCVCFFCSKGMPISYPLVRYPPEVNRRM